VAAVLILVVSVMAVPVAAHVTRQHFPLKPLLVKVQARSPRWSTQKDRPVLEVHKLERPKRRDKSSYPQGMSAMTLVWLQ